MDETGSQNLPEINSVTRILESLPVGLLAFDNNFNVTFLNDNIYRFGILQPDKLVEPGDSVLSGIFKTALGVEADLQTLLHGDFIEKELRSDTTLSGDEISVLLKAAPLFEGETFIGGVVLVEDIKTKTKSDGRGDIFSESAQLVVRALADVILICDASGKVIHHSTAAPDPLKLLKKIKTGVTTFHEAFLPELQEEIEIHLRNLHQGHLKEYFVFSTASADEKKYAEVSIIRLSGIIPGGDLHIFALHDITTWMQETGDLQKEIEELRHYEVITNASSDAVISLSARGDITFWNKSAEQLFGFSRSQIYGKNFTKALRLIEANQFNEILAEVNTGKQAQRQITCYIQDKEIIVDMIFSPLERQNGQNEILILCSDITGRMKLNAHLEVLIERLNSVYNAFPDIVIRYNYSGKMISWNKAFEDVTAFSSDSGGLSLYDFIPDTDFITKITSGPTQEGEFLQHEIVTRSGVQHIAKFRVIADVQEEKGAVTYTTLVHDITEELLFEKELSLMQSVFATSEDGIAIESGGKYILANDAFVSLFGYASMESMAHLDYFSIVSPEEKPLFEQYIKSRAEGESSTSRFEFLGIKKDSSRFHIEASVTHFQFQGQEFTVLIVRDISERKRNQQAVKESEERYRSITENLDDFFWTAEKFKGQMKTIFYSAAVEKMIGYTQTELLVDSKLFLKLIYPDDFAEVKQELKKFYQNYYKKSTELVFRLLHKQGNIVWVRNKLTAIRDRRGEITKMYGLVSDISSQKKAEQVLQESTENLTKLNEAKDRFISIISHDLRTPFSSIMGFTDILMNEDDLSAEEMRNYVKYIRDSAQSMLTLVNSLLDWTKIQTGRINFEPNRQDLSEIVGKIISTVQGVALKKDIEIINHVEKDIFVFVDEGLLMQVFNNLFSNALKFTYAKGKIEVFAEHSEHPRFLKVTVKDSGVGMSEENLQKLFKLDSKLTTEGTAGEKGTGLGLTLVWEIINRHGGKIWAESEKGKGAEFIFTLPKASAKILLVDDSNTDRILYSKILKNITKDYEVLLATNGKEALKLIETSAPALVITDHLMPVMNGLDFVRTLQYSGIKGKPPVIILSGDVGKSETLAYNDLGVEYVFSKPVNLTSFKDAVEKCLKKLLK